MSTLLDSSLYTDEIRAYVRSRPWPADLIYEIVEYEDSLGLRFIRLNINGLSIDDKLRLAPIINDTMTTIRNKGIPIYTEVRPGNGQRV